MSPPRPASDTIEILRRTLMDIERDLDPVSDAASLATLKRIVLNRIAECEVQQALEAQSAARSIRPLSISNKPQQPTAGRGDPDKAA